MIEKEKIFSKVVAKFSVTFVNLLALNTDLKLSFDNLIETFKVELRADESCCYVVGSWDEVQSIRNGIYKHLISQTPNTSNDLAKFSNGVSRDKLGEIIENTFDFFNESGFASKDNGDNVERKFVSHDANEIINNQNTTRISSQNTFSKKTTVKTKDFLAENLRDNNADYNNNEIDNDLDAIMNIFEIYNADNQNGKNAPKGNLLENEGEKILIKETSMCRNFVDLDKKQDECAFAHNFNNDNEDNIKTLELMMNIKKNEDDNLVEYLLGKNFENTSYSNHTAQNIQTSSDYQNTNNNYDTKVFNSMQQMNGEESPFFNFNPPQLLENGETVNYVCNQETFSADNILNINNNESIFETGSKNKGQLVNLSSAILDLCIQEQTPNKTTENIQMSVMNQISKAPLSSSQMILNNSFIPITSTYTTNVLLDDNQRIMKTTHSNVVQSNLNGSNTHINSVPSVVSEDNKNSNFCQLCNKTFLNKSNLIRHQKSIHRKNVTSTVVSDMDKNRSNATVKNMTADLNHSNSDNNRDKREFHFDGGNEKSVDKNSFNISLSKRSKKSLGKTCRFCLKAFSSSSVLVEHLKYCKDVFKCSRCNEIFETHNLLSQHLYNQHELFSCWMCDKVADSMESYADHVNFCHPSYQLDKTDTSMQFNQALPSINQLQQPQQMMIKTQQMTPVLPQIQPPPTPTEKSTLDVTKAMRCHGPNPCIKCGKVFSTFSNLLKHVRVIHENSRFPCNLCKRVFACKEGLKSHLNKIHEKTSHKCSICSMEFENQLRLAKHLSLIHNNQSSIHSFQCDQCSKSFLYKTNLKRHKKLDHEGLRYVCDRCFQPFRSKSQLLEHTRISHLGQPLQCSLCPSQFHSWGVLRDHERAVHNKHSPIVCAICGAKFNRYPSLSYHLKKNHKRRFNVAGEIIYDPKKPSKTLQKKQSKIAVITDATTTQQQTIMNNLNNYENTFSQNFFPVDNTMDSKNVHTDFMKNDNSNDKSKFEMANEMYNLNANISSADLFNSYNPFPYNNDVALNTNKQKTEQNLNQFQSGSNDGLTHLFSQPPFFQSEQHQNSFLKTLEQSSVNDLVSKTESLDSYSKETKKNEKNTQNEQKFYENFF